MRVTVEMLKDRRACKPQLDLFIELGLDGVEITEELCIKHAQDFEWNWAAGNLLSLAQWKEYNRAIAPAQEKYRQVEALARANFDRAAALALAEYDRATAPAREEYNIACASAFYAASRLIDGGADDRR